MVFQRYLELVERVDNFGQSAAAGVFSAALPPVVVVRLKAKSLPIGARAIEDKAGPGILSPQWMTGLHVILVTQSRHGDPIPSPLLAASLLSLKSPHPLRHRQRFRDVIQMATL
jgi:hypothetical protein